jgi:hypothetical protein
MAAPVRPGREVAQAFRPAKARPTWRKASALRLRSPEGLRHFLLLLVLVLSPFVSTPLAIQRVDEYRLKAAVLYNLAKFVEWPDEAFADPTAPLVVCVLGVDPFGAALDDTLRGHSVGGHATVARRIADVTPGCHVLFVANSEAKRLPAILDRTRTSSVLIVGEASGFIDRGGMIGLATDDDRVRFEVNLAAADRAHLRISSRVMALASAVRRVEERVR